MSYIEVKNLNYKYDNYLVLDNISFNIEKGDIVSVIGPNGSGKTTLLKNIIGILEPSSGQIKINNKFPKQMYNQIAYVPQRFEFDRDVPINVYEFMALERCKNNKHGLENINKALAEVALFDIEKRKLGELSGGQFQRVVIARALLHEKELLVFDEPSTGIDVAGGIAIYDLIKNINEQKKVTCLIVSHELNIVSKYSKLVLCINNKMCCYGKPYEVLTEKTIKDLYGVNVSLYHGHNKN